MANANLSAAKAAKNDEFYTELPEISAELNNYTDKFQGKVVICNCDDPAESNFVKYFLMNFNRLGLKELIATGYQTSPVRGKRVKLWSEPYAIRVTETKSYLVGTQTDLDAKGVDYFLTTERDRISYPLYGNYAVDKNGERVQIDVKEEYVDEKTGKTKKRTVKHDLYYEAGDFRSDMCVELLRQADIVVTNPPFSLFREYVAQLMQYEKQFLIIGNKNAITYKEIFPLLKDNLMWMGYGFPNGNAYFRVASGKTQFASGVYDAKTGLVKFRNACWFTNLDHWKRHQMLPLDLGFTYVGHEDMYPMYDNYDAINVDKVSEIPCDYMGVMGVPITFLEKYCPEQFKILNCNDFRRCDAVPFKPSGLVKDKEASITAEPRAESREPKQPADRICTNSYPEAIWLPVQYLMDEKSTGGFSSVEELREAVAVWCGCSPDEVPFTDVIGVPITFLDKHCPEQFEIVGGYNYSMDVDGHAWNAKINGQYVFKRILIRRK